MMTRETPISTSTMKKWMKAFGSNGIQTSREARKMAEVATADASDGSVVTVQSPQENPTSKAVSDKDSETTEPESEQKPARKSRITSKATATKQPERDHRGIVKSQWDNPAADPNLRKHVGEDPTGESNVLPVTDAAE